MRRPAVAILIISLFMAVPVITGPREDAKSMIVVTTRPRFDSPLAEQGDAESQHARVHVQNRATGIVSRSR
jgi:hypothetical protein